MKKLIKIILTLQIVSILMGGLLYQCIQTREHPLLGIYIMATFWIITYNVIINVSKWIDKIFDNE